MDKPSLGISIHPVKTPHMSGMSKLRPHEKGARVARAGRGILAPAQLLVTVFTSASGLSYYLISQASGLDPFTVPVALLTLACLLRTSHCTP